MAGFGAEPAGRQAARAATPEVTTVERPLPLTLEELFKGTHKKMKIKRKAFDEVTGKRTTQDKVLEMDIKPGLKKGSKIKFKGVGDQEDPDEERDPGEGQQRGPHPGGVVRDRLRLVGLELDGGLGLDRGDVRDQRFDLRAQLVLAGARAGGGLDGVVLAVLQVQALRGGVVEQHQ